MYSSPMTYLSNTVRPPMLHFSQDRGSCKKSSACRRMLLPDGHETGYQAKLLSLT